MQKHLFAFCLLMLYLHHNKVSDLCDHCHGYRVLQLASAVDHLTPQYLKNTFSPLIGHHNCSVLLSSSDSSRPELLLLPLPTKMCLLLWRVKPDNQPPQRKYLLSREITLSPQHLSSYCTPQVGQNAVAQVFVFYSFHRLVFFALFGGSEQVAHLRNESWLQNKCQRMRPIEGVACGVKPTREQHLSLSLGIRLWLCTGHLYLWNGCSGKAVHRLEKPACRD